MHRLFLYYKYFMLILFFAVKITHFILKLCFLGFEGKTDPYSHRQSIKPTFMKLGILQYSSVLQVRY